MEILHSSLLLENNMKISSLKYLNDTTSGHFGDNSFRLYDPEIAESITKDGRRIMVDAMMSINEILAGGCKPGQMIVLCGKGGGSRLNELQEIDNDTKEPRSTEVSEPV